MRQGRKLVVAALAAAALGSGQLAAWSSTSAATDPISTATGRLQADAVGPLTLLADVAGGYTFVGVPSGTSVDDPAVGASTGVAAAAAAHLERYGDAFGAGRAGTTLVRDRSSTAVVGDTVRFQQQVDGVPVLGGQVVMSLRPDRELSSVLARVTHTTKVTAATLAQGDADRLAREAFTKAAGPGTGLRVTSLGRWLLDPGLLDGPSTVGVRTGWRYEIARGAAERRMIVVDDRSGSLLMNADMVDHVNRVVCNDNDTPRSSAAADPAPCTTATPPVRVEGQAATGTADVDLAYDYAGAVSDFYQQIGGIDLTALIGRDIGGGTRAIAQTVRFCFTGSCPAYANAFWNGVQMYYGNGFASADDVVGHEMTHGVTERSSNLFYWGQSGAMNESISDIMGEIIDHRFASPGDSPTNWRVGEALPAPYAGGIRDMADPTVFGDPDRTGSANYVRQTGGYTDEDGVHSNSGVGNKTFYLISQGGTFNGQTITGIDTGDASLTKSGKLWLLVDQTLASGSDYADEGAVLNQSCQALLAAGTTGFTAATCTAVQQATTATQLATTPTANPQPADATAVCPAGTTLRVLFDSESGDPATKFTPGPTWSRNGVPGWGPVAHSKPASWASSNPGTAGASSLVMAAGLTLPAGQPSYLFFQQWRLLEYDPSFYDGGTVEVDDTGDAAGPVDVAALPWVNGPSDTIASGFANPAAGRKAFGGDSRGYLASRLDLSSFAGRTVTPQFTTNTDNSTGYIGWYVDDVQVYTCDAVVTPPPPPPPPPPAPQPSSAAGAKARGKLMKAVVKWQPPSTNAAQVTGYRVTTTGKTVTVAASARKAVIGGLKQGKSYVFSVVAVGSGGYVAPATKVSAAGTKTSLKVEGTAGHTGLRGALVKGSKGLKGKVLKVLTKKNGTWVKLTQVTTGKGGKYAVEVSGTSSRPYRVLFKGALALMGSQSPKRHL